MSDNKDRKSEPIDYMSEHDKVFRHIEELERKGMLNEEELARIEERIRTITELQKREIDRNIEDIRERYAPKPIKQTAAQKVAVIAIVVVLVGAILELTIGRGFIFAKADAYRSIGIWVFVGSLPIVTIAIYRSPKVNVFSNGFLSRWIIKPLAFLVGALIFSGFIVMAPLGYLALAGVLMPGEYVEMDAKVTSMGLFSKRSKSCDQKASLQLAWSSAEICLENRVAGKTPSVNDEVVLRGKLTVFGLYIDEIEAMESAKH